MSTADSPSAEEFVIRLRQGDPVAQEQLVREHSEQIRRSFGNLVTKAIRAKIDMDDILQEIWMEFFCTILPKGTPIATKTALKNIIYGTARNVAIRVSYFYTRQKRDARRERSLTSFEIDKISPTRTEDETLDWGDVSIPKLDTNASRVLQLVRKGYSTTRIASELEYDERSIRRIFARAQEALLRANPQLKA